MSLKERAKGKDITVPPVASWRRYVVVAILALASVGVFARAFHLQVMERSFLVTEGDKRHIRTLALPGHRGAVLDRNGVPLALSAPVDSLWTVPAELLKPEAAAHRAALAKMLQRKPAEFDRFLRAQSKKKFVYLLRNQSPDIVARMLKLKAPGVFAERSYARYYPAGEVVGQVVGFCGRDGYGLEGLEKEHEASLAGIKGFRQVIRAVDGRVVEDTGNEQPARSGADLTLTLDLRLQYLAHRELAAAVTRNKAQGGMVVVADARTGEILAATASPAYNPNNPADRKVGLKNRGITDRLEPGSTLKPLTVAIALDSKKYTANSHIDTLNGQLKVGSWTVRDIHPEGVVDLAKLLAKSSNVGSALMGLRLGPQTLRQGFADFGIGKPLNVGFPGEVSGSLRPIKVWREAETATAAYGYGVSMSALHLVRAYAGLANDGVMPSLSLVRGQSTGPAERAVSAESARAVMQMMRGVISLDGTGVRAGVAGYTVAGKTGTVRKLKVTGGYETGRHWSAFVGVMPATDPRLVGLVFVDEPTAGAYYGGLVAAPVFSSVVGGAARLMQIPQDAPEPEPAPSEASLPAKAAQLERHQEPQA
jgi:cell division protein FtsI (penicillin-binding protein 3)